VERRACVRYPANVQVFCEARASEEVPWQSELRDFSAGGFSLLLSRRCEVGMELMIELPACLPSAAPMVPIRVVRVQAAADGKWVTGCEVIELFGDAERVRLDTSRARR
jgi:hypothetical protein